MNILPQNHSFDQKVNWLLAEASRLESTLNTSSSNPTARVEALFKKIIEVCIDYHKAQSYDSSTLLEIFRKAENITRSLGLQENETVQQFHKIVKPGIDIPSLPEELQTASCSFLEIKEVLELQEIDPSYNHIGDRFFLDRLNKGEPINFFGFSLQTFRSFLERQGTKIQHLNFCGCPFNNADLLFILQDQSLRNIQHLDFFNLLTNKLVVQIAKFTRLKELTLYSSGLTPPLIDLLSNMEPLEALNISGNKITERHVKSLKNLTRLRYLTAISCNLNDSTLDFVKDFLDLEYLNVSLNRHINFNGMDALKRLKKLKVLRADFCILAGPCMSIIETLLELETLILGLTALNDQEVKCLENLTKLKTLTFKFSGTSGPLLACIQNLRSLEILNLTWYRFKNPVTEEEKETLKSLKIKHLFIEY